MARYSKIIVEFYYYDEDGKLIEGEATRDLGGDGELTYLVKADPRRRDRGVMTRGEANDLVRRIARTIEEREDHAQRKLLRNRT